MSARKGPFVAVNCGALPPNLVESQLFGHTKGAFTGAVGPQEGLFQRARGGTMSLDEIGELPLPLQPKRLRAIEEKEVLPIGAPTPSKIDVRLIAATNRDLKTEAEAGRFRADLYYRLNVIELGIPPLRDRREDIPYLTAAFIRDCGQRMRKSLNGLTPAAERLLFNARWDGNVRELKNVIERACMLAEGTTLSERELSGAFGPETPAAPGRPRPADVRPAGTEAPPPLETIERDHILDVLRQVNGNRMAAAKVLGISRRALYRRLERHRIEEEIPKPPSGRRSSS
jgi:transcriptional regulator with PAS, ATPase and Fis domain